MRHFRNKNMPIGATFHGISLNIPKANNFHGTWSKDPAHPDADTPLTVLPTRRASEGIHSAFLLDNEDQTMLSFSPNYDYRCLELDAGSPELFVFSLFEFFSRIFPGI